MAEAAASGPTARTVQNAPVVDLSGMRSREEAAGLTLVNVALVLVPEDIPDLLRGASCTNVAAIIPVPAGTRVESRIGQMELSGQALAAGDSAALLCLIGQVVVTAPVPAVGYRGLILVGQILLPRSAQEHVAARILHEIGQVTYYDDDAKPWVFHGNTRLTAGFLDLLEEPRTLILMDQSTFAADVTPQLLRGKASGLVLLGDATVEEETLLPMVQYLAKTSLGSIRLAGAGEPGA